MGLVDSYVAFYRMVISLTVNGLEWGEMAGYWDYIGTLVEFPDTKSVHGFDENINFALTNVPPVCK